MNPPRVQPEDYIDFLIATPKAASAAEAYQTALLIDPKDNDVRLGLAKAQIAAKQPAKARGTLEELLKHDPEHKGAKELQKSLRE